MEKEQTGALTTNTSEELPELNASSLRKNQNSQENLVRLGDEIPALFQVHRDTFSKRDSHSFNRAETIPCVHLQEKLDAGGTLVENHVNFTKISPLPSRFSLRTLSERFMKPERISFANF